MDASHLNADVAHLSLAVEVLQVLNEPRETSFAKQRPDARAQATSERRTQHNRRTRTRTMDTRENQTLKVAKSSFSVLGPDRGARF